MTRKKIWWRWLLISVLSSVLASTISMLYWGYTHVPEEKYSYWSPISDMGGMYILMPFGWLLSVATPFGWLNLIGLVLALYKIDLRPLLVSAIGSVMFGLFWPKVSVGILGI